MFNIVAVGLGGFIGAILRYSISSWSAKLSHTFPFGTLFVNVLGGLLIGLIMEISFNTYYINPTMRIFLTTGLMGGLTTFSTFSYETVGMLASSHFGLGMVNIVANLCLSLMGVWAGKGLGQLIQ